MAKYLKSCSMPLSIRKMKIKTTLGFDLTPARMAKMNLRANEKC